MARVKSRAMTRTVDRPGDCRFRRRSRSSRCGRLLWTRCTLVRTGPAVAGPGVAGGLAVQRSAGGLAVEGFVWSGVVIVRANGRVGLAVLRVIARVAAGAARSWWVGASVQVSRTFGDGQVGSRSV